MAERLVVIGGDAGGLSAATNARRRQPELEIVVFERGDWVSFSACGEPYYIAGEVEPLERLVVRAPEWFAGQRIDIHRRHEVVAIDIDQRTVTVRDLDALEEHVEGYDYLVYATGAIARRARIEGRDLANVFELRTLDDARAIREAVDAGARRAVIVGGGWIGLEMAEAFVTRGLDTTLVSSGPGLLDGAVDLDISERLAGHLRASGVEVITGHRVTRLEGRDGVVTAADCGVEVRPADIVLLAIGAAPNVDLARMAGLRIGESGAVWVDEQLRTSAPRVWAAGDCAESTHVVSGRRVNLFLGDVANKQGRIVGRNITGASERFPGVLGTAIARCLGLEVSRTGLAEAEARGAGFDVFAVTFSARPGAAYWPGMTPVAVRIVMDRGSRRLLGAQIAGGPGSAKRIDTFAVALWNAMTADALVHVDLAYAPPFSGAWDPVLVAARGALDALEAQ